MHRILSKFLLLAAIYVTAGCTATHPPLAPQQLPPGGVSQPGAMAPASAPLAASAPAAAEPVLAANAQPHIALLLPLKSASPELELGAKAVEQGFIAAAAVQPGGLPVRIYACSDEAKEIAALYQQAVHLGAQAVVGPLTPAGVAEIVKQPAIPVPTLVLNRADVKAADKLYFFSLLLDNEARQVARLASTADLHTAIIVSADDGLSKRIAAAFADEWKKLGGKVAASMVFKGDTDMFESLPVNIGNMVFVASDANTARKFRPFLNPMLPVYATSQIFNGNSEGVNTLINYDLREVVFIDMPWLLQPDRASVMRYARANPPLKTDKERLYARGIDSYRLIRILLDNRQQSALPLDGVTGTIRLNPNHQFDREALLAEFKDGKGLTPEAINQLNAAKRQAGGNGPLPADPVERE